jgi:hypothetical protein
MKCSEIRNELEKQNPDEVWSDFIKWVETLIPFWKQAVISISEHTDFDVKKRDKHLSVIDDSVSFMNDWRFDRIKHVKARRNEIDSAISFIRNNALNKKVSKFLFAPICRNLAGILRHTLYLSTKGYSDKQLPTVVSQDIFALAEVYLCFPFDEGNFVFYLPKGKSIHTKDENDLDNYHLMLDIAGKKLNIEDFIKAINHKSTEIWENFKSPKNWQFSDKIWITEIENVSNELYYENMKQFYRK